MNNFIPYLFATASILTFSCQNEALERPYRFLEDKNDPKTIDWVLGQQALAQDYYKKNRSALSVAEEDISQFFPPKLEPFDKVKKHGKVFFFADSTGGKPKFYLTENGKTSVLTDPDTQKDISKKFMRVSPDGNYIAYLAGDEGADFKTLKVLNLKTGKNLQHQLKNCKIYSRFKWNDDSQGFLFRCRIKNQTITAREHNIFSSYEEDAILGKSVRLELPDGDYDILKTTEGALKYRLRGDTGPFSTLIKDRDLIFDPIHLSQNGAFIFKVKSNNFPDEKIVSFKEETVSTPEKWHEIIPHTQGRPIQEAQVINNDLYVQFIENCSETVYKITLNQGKPTSIDTIHVPNMSTQSFYQSDKKIIFEISSLVANYEPAEYDPKTNRLSDLKKNKLSLEMPDLVAEQYYATSEDSVKIPISLVYKKGAKMDGSAMMFMEVYGGHESPMLPDLSYREYPFVREGGVYAIAHVRGGGEFGQNWHKTGSFDKKENAIKDAIACTKHLQKNGISSPERTIIRGASGGGLVALSASVRAPELYGAVIASSPLVDVMRQDVGINWNWNAEYGHPAYSGFKAIIKRYAPLENIDKNKTYPAYMINGGLLDERVLSWHGMKFAAMIKDCNPYNTVIFDMDSTYHHGVTGYQNRRSTYTGKTMIFLESELGPINQDNYKGVAGEQRHNRQKQYRP